MRLLTSIESVKRSVDGVGLLFHPFGTVVFSTARTSIALNNTVGLGPEQLPVANYRQSWSFRCTDSLCARG
jgi:hypothetical protein